MIIHKVTIRTFICRLVLPFGLLTPLYEEKEEMLITGYWQALVILRQDFNPSVLERKGNSWVRLNIFGTFAGNSQCSVPVGTAWVWFVLVCLVFLQGQDVFDNCLYLFGVLIGRVCVLSPVSFENDVWAAFPPFAQQLSQQRWTQGDNHKNILTSCKDTCLCWGTV